MNLRESLDYILSNWSMAVEEKFADHYLAGFFRNDFCAAKVAVTGDEP